MWQAIKDKPWSSLALAGLLAISASQLIRIEFCLLAGIALALTLGNPVPNETKKFSRFTLQLGVVASGLSLNFAEVAHAGFVGFLGAAAVVLLAFALTAIAVRFALLNQNSGWLLAAGNSICGATAIAAVSSVIKPKDDEVGVALGTIFLLNAAAIFIFPSLGHALNLNPSAYGIWVGLAVHDFASVAACGTAMGATSLATALAVKTARILYLIPITLAISWSQSRTTSLQGVLKAIPPFVYFLIVAVAIGLLVAVPPELATGLKFVARSLYNVALVMIGAGITRELLKSLKWQSLAVGVAVWIVIAGMALGIAVTWAP